MTDATARYTSFRIALASGLLGAAGATLGWLAWLTTRVANAELALTVLVGASLGLAVHWIQHYVRVARAERTGNVVEHAGTTPPTVRSRAAFAWAAGFGFLGLVTEHLVADMAAEFLQPLLASLAALLPAGMIIGWSMSRGRINGEGFVGVIFMGAAVGAVITLTTGVLWKIGFGDAPWAALFAWWGLIGIGTRIVTRQERHNVRVYDPLLAVLVVFLGLLVLDQLPSSFKSYEIFGPWRGVPAGLRAMALEIHQSPALPATFWMTAEQRFVDKEAGRDCPVIAAAPAPPPPTPADTAPTIVSSDPLQAAIDRAARPAAPTTPVVTVAAPEPKPGAGTEFLRSWLVIVLFAAGVGLVPWLERTLRPIDYPNSETYRRDLTLTVAVVIMLAGACFFARIDQRKAQAHDDACRMAELMKQGTRP